MLPAHFHGLRSLARRPGFALVAVFTLALGLGAATLVFGVVDGILVQPLPYPDADRLVRVFHTAPALGLVDDLGLSDATYFRLRDEAGLLDLAIYRAGAVNLDADGRPERVATAWVSHDLGPALGAVPLVGRPLAAAGRSHGGRRTCWSACRWPSPSSSSWPRA